MSDRGREGRGMHGPELAVLLAYAKRHLTEALVASDLPDDPYFDRLLSDYFPAKMAARYEELILQHPLRRELIATIVANEILNSQGITFASRLEAETGAGPAEIVRAYRVARQIVGASARWRDVEALAGTVDAEIVNELMNGVDELVEIVTRWFISEHRVGSISGDAEAYRPGFEELAEIIDELGSKRWRSQLERKVTRLVDAGVPEIVAQRHAYQTELAHAPDIIDVAALSGLPLRDVGHTFFLAGQAFHLNWLERAVEGLPTSNRWQRWGALTLDRELMDLRRAIVQKILADGGGKDAATLYGEFNELTSVEQARIARMVDLLKREGVSGSSSIVVAIRQLQRLTG